MVDTISLDRTRDTTSTMHVNTTQPLNAVEKWGFYGYAIAFFPYTMASANLIPSMILMLAYQAGVTDKGISCLKAPRTSKCQVNVLGASIPVDSFALYVNSVAVIIQAILLLFFSALADRGHWRHRFIILFTVLGGIPAVLCLIPNLSYYGISILSILANVGSNMGSGFSFSLLPVLAWRHKTVLFAQQTGTDLRKAKDQAVNHLSAWSFALGFTAASGILFAALGIAKLLPKGAYSLQVGVGIAGAWYLIGGVASWFMLYKPEGPKLPMGHSVLTHSLRMIWRSILEVPKAGDLWLGLLSWFFISDGLATLVLNGVIVGRSELQVPVEDILLLSAVAPLVEAVGIILINYFKLTLGKCCPQLPCLSSSKSISLFLTLISLIFSAWGIWGISTKIQYYIFFLGSVTLYATLQSIHRALFAQLVPQGQESEFFGLYLLSARTTSWIGSLASGSLRQFTQSLSSGFIVCLILFVGGFGSLLLLQVDRYPILPTTHTEDLHQLETKSN